MDSSSTDYKVSAQCWTGIKDKQHALFFVTLQCRRLIHLGATITFRFSADSDLHAGHPSENVNSALGRAAPPRRPAPLLSANNQYAGFSFSRGHVSRQPFPKPPSSFPESSPCFPPAAPTGATHRHSPAPHTWRPHKPPARAGAAPYPSARPGCPAASGCVRSPAPLTDKLSLQIRQGSRGTGETEAFRQRLPAGRTAGSPRDASTPGAGAASPGG